jgi:hypothetical protein
MRRIVKTLVYAVLLAGLVSIALGQDQIGTPSAPILRDDSGLWTSPEGLPIPEANWYVGEGLDDVETGVIVEPVDLFDWMWDVICAPWGVD